MKLFTINEEGKFVQFKEKSFQEENREIDLEVLLENNPEYFFDDGKILVIGRQVTTNFNTFIDLLGIDKNGNTVAIELKRGKTPRETIAQILEYAAFVEKLDYDELNEIFQNYQNEDIDLDEFHKQYFGSDIQDTNVSFNKSTKLVITAQDISPEIKQTAMFLRESGIEIYCVEFKYFVNKSRERMISSDFVVGSEEFLKTKIKSAASLPKTDKEQFISSLDDYGLSIFTDLFNFADKENLLFRWGSKGFSMNVNFDNGFAGLYFAYPPNSIFRQSIYVDFAEISKKVNNPDEVIDFYKGELLKLDVFEPARTQLKWVITKKHSADKTTHFLYVLKQVIEKIKLNGLKTD